MNIKPKYNLQQLLDRCKSYAESFSMGYGISEDHLQKMLVNFARILLKEMGWEEFSEVPGAVIGLTGGPMKATLEFNAASIPLPLVQSDFALPESVSRPKKVSNHSSAYVHGLHRWASLMGMSVQELHKTVDKSTDDAIKSQMEKAWVDDDKARGIIDMGIYEDTEVIAKPASENILTKEQMDCGIGSIAYFDENDKTESKWADMEKSIRNGMQVNYGIESQAGHLCNTLMLDAVSIIDGKRCFFGKDHLGHKVIVRDDGKIAYPGSKK